MSGPFGFIGSLHALRKTMAYSNKLMIIINFRRAHKRSVIHRNGFIGSLDIPRRAQGRSDQTTPNCWRCLFRSPSQSEGCSIGKKPNCWLFETPISLYYSALSEPLGHKAKSPLFRVGFLTLLGAWRCTTLAWHLPHYHRRSCVSLLSSEWIQVVPQRYCHQAKTDCLSLT